MGILQFDSEISYKDSESSTKTIKETTIDNEQDKVCPILLAEVLSPHQVLQMLAGEQRDQAEAAREGQYHLAAILSVEIKRSNQLADQVQEGGCYSEASETGPEQEEARVLLA